MPETVVADDTWRHVGPESLPTGELPQVMKSVIYTPGWVVLISFLMRYLILPLSHLAPVTGFKNK